MKIKIFVIDCVDPIGEITLPEGKLSPFWEEKREDGKIIFNLPVEIDPEEGKIYILDGAGHGCRCDGCAQDDCEKEYQNSPLTGEEFWYCPFCCASSGGQWQEFFLPKGSRVEPV